ncbi:MAG: HAD hydrolase-like protein, partial [Ktedonobacterales bacterium]
ETLSYLGPRHELILVTKGDVDEQQMKIDASGLAGYFRRAVIVAEKDVATYQSLVEELTVTPADGWMIGNSPRSDINPALAVGLNAVFVPHPHTWRLEHEELQPIDGRQLLTVERFADLRQHF